MTFSGRIRLMLVAIAIVPALLIMAVIYFHFEKQISLADTRRANDTLERYKNFSTIFQSDLREKIERLKSSPELKRSLVNIKSGRSGRLEIDPHSFGLDFLEIVDSSATVLATYHRPGLLGQKIDIPAYKPFHDTAYARTSVEYDLEGAHAAFARRVPLEGNAALYTGKYIDEPLIAQLSLIVDATVKLYFPSDSANLTGFEAGTYWPEEGTFRLALDGAEPDGFLLMASFPLNSSKSTFVALFGVAGLVAVAAAVLAILLGLYFTGKAKREIENLVSATSRIAEGDFNTPVMAYDEGEFSDLADSISEMMFKLKRAQNQLATTEKIAAWQTVGRKIAHEIKNPLSPIAISAEDLRISYKDNLPDFDKILTETTGTIKSEVERLTKLLDEFVAFARMAPPTIKTVKPDDFIDSISILYRTEIDQGRVVINNKSDLEAFKFDPESFKQVLINLIKNGLEASEKSRVNVDIAEDDGILDITVSDTGPGFSEERLANSFEPYSSTKPGGSGLGLVICHRIVHDHGGTMEISNHTGGGAVVHIRLPQ